MKGIFYIEKLGEPMEVQSQKVEGGKLAKRMVILREIEHPRTQRELLPGCGGRHRPYPLSGKSLINISNHSGL